jgi:hypothetical protein
MHWNIYKEATVGYFRALPLHLPQQTKKITTALIS